jgi:hypothetical protein
MACAAKHRWIDATTTENVHRAAGPRSEGATENAAHHRVGTAAAAAAATAQSEGARIVAALRAATGTAVRFASTARSRCGGELLL